MFRPLKIVVNQRESEFASEHLIGAINIPLNQIREEIESFPKDAPFYIYCAGGYRSMIAASVLKQLGRKEFADLEGGFNEIKRHKLPLSEYIEPVSYL